MGGSLIMNLILLGQLPSLLATKSPSRKRKKVNGYEGDGKGEYNVKKSKTLKSCKALLQKNQ